MSTAIFYFSGTGNSLFVAKKLGAMLPEPLSIHPIAGVRATGLVRISADRVIIVFPVYFQTIPAIVADFLRKTVFATPSQVIYGIATCNGGPGHSIYTMKRILKKRGQILRAGFCITMPGNSLILRDFTNSEEEQNRRLRECFSRIEEIGEYINERRGGRLEGNDGVKPHFQGMITGLVARKIYRTPVKFRTTDACTRCGTCSRVCPVMNIKIGPDNVIWGTNCEQCLACFHWCPRQAIEIGQTTVGKRRYHHPEISICEMYTMNGSPGVM
jgi:ferredoxin